MSVFLSWSGELSRLFAAALRSWLSIVAPAVKPWMSSSDIQPGHVWYRELEQTLGQVDFAILCITRQSSTAPWLLFETGYLMRALPSGRVVPFLLDFEPNELSGPIASLQAIRADQAGTRRLVRALTEAHAFTESEKLAIVESFQDHWPDLASKLHPQTAVPRGHHGGIDLSPRQAEIFNLLVKGCTSKEIARELLLSEGTVRTHIAAIMRAFGATSRLQLLLTANRFGLARAFVRK